MMWTSWAPRRSAVRAESIATLPPPKTATLRDGKIGVSASSFSYAFMRLERVRYSFAEKTPTRFSPSKFMNFGSPAPVPTKMAS
ncbi:MAG: hypothetical protein BWY82_01706 [Verrucomicrobia bacterium ADurb.Bin474]|nr:MAG: hypothetical protein BWY82_01706 [Verrucomicrobia bacterium ADurb.Bin474]